MIEIKRASLYDLNFTYKETIEDTKFLDATLDNHLCYKRKRQFRFSKFKTGTDFDNYFAMLIKKNNKQVNTDKLFSMTDENGRKTTLDFVSYFDKYKVQMDLTSKMDIRGDYV